MKFAVNLRVKLTPRNNYQNSDVVLIINAPVRCT